MSLFEDASLIITPNGRKSGKIFSLKPFDGSGDLTVVRATTKTEVNSSGVIVDVPINVPSFDYTNGSCPSILVEPQRTNVTQQSEDFSNGYWVKTNSDINSNTAIAPDGNLTADTFSDRVLTNQTYLIARNQSYTSGTAYTSSFFAKNLDRRYVYVRFVSSVFGTNKYVFFDLQLGTIISVSSGVTAEIIDYGNGWFRCIATSTASVTTSTVNGIFIGLSDNGVNVSYTNPSVKSIYLWGAQLEEGSNATSYIPTVASAVTRNADVISKTIISDLIGQTEGTMYVEIAPLTIESTSRDIEISDGNTNRVIIQFNSTGIGAFVIVGGVVQASFSFNNLDTNFKKVALKYKVNDFSLFVDGVKVAFDTSGTTFPLNTLTRLDFKKVTPSSLEYYGKVKSLCLWKTALTDTQLSQLTTP